MRRRNSAQGMTEYIIIVGLIAVGVILAVAAFGDLLNVTMQGGETSITTQTGNVANNIGRDPNEEEEEP